MNLIDRCFDIYTDFLLMFDERGDNLTAVLDVTLCDLIPNNVLAPLHDTLGSYACDAERHGFEAGFRFALASQILLGDMGQMKKNQNILMNLEGGKA